MLKRILALATLFIMASTAHAVVLRDDRQIELTMSNPPQRILRLSPSLT